VNLIFDKAAGIQALSLFLFGATCLSLLAKRKVGLPFPGADRFNALPPSPYARAVLWLKRSALAFLLLAAFQPEIYLPSVPQGLPKEGIALYLILDQSGSMQDGAFGAKSRQSKMAALKEMTKQFIQARQSDLIGLVSFARTAEVLAPLTLDQNALEQALDGLQPAGSQETDGTAIGYALFKTVNLMLASAAYKSPFKKAPFDAKHMVAVIVTDGLDTPNPLDRDNPLRSLSMAEGFAFAKQSGIRVYMINVEPSLRLMQYAQVKQQLEQLTAMTGGKLFLSDSESLKEAYAEIDRIERMPISIPRTAFYPLSPLLLTIGALCLLLSFVIKSLWLRSAF
jgi:Ca-activated chloride channel family protein